jgi:hypothetical protein
MKNNNNMITNSRSSYKLPDRFMYEDNYHSDITMVPSVEKTIEYLKQEIENASSIDPAKNLRIGIGIGDFMIKVHLAKEASKRRELSDNVSTRDAEIILREHAKQFPNVKSVSINTGVCHISKMPISVIGNYSEN